MNEHAEYRRRLGVMPNPKVASDIARLDAAADCEAIVRLLSTYEFPWDIARSLEIALFFTYGSDSVSRLLDRTGQFRNKGQKRYDDTRLLIAQFMESELKSGIGTRAVIRMNHIHSHYVIPNDDFLFVLWSFIIIPLDWLEDFGWRRPTAHERLAWFEYFVRLGERMSLTDIPRTFAAFERFVADYEATHLVYTDANRRVADATVAIYAGWLPKFVHPLLLPVIRTLIPLRLCAAFGYAPPNGALRAVVRGALRARAIARRLVAFERYPDGIATTPNRTYPGNSYRIEELGPVAAAE